MLPPNLGAGSAVPLPICAAVSGKPAATEFILSVPGPRRPLRRRAPRIRLAHTIGPAGSVQRGPPPTGRPLGDPQLSFSPRLRPALPPCPTLSTEKPSSTILPER